MLSIGSYLRDTVSVLCALVPEAHCLPQSVAEKYSMCMWFFCRKHSGTYNACALRASLRAAGTCISSAYFVQGASTLLHGEPILSFAITYGCMQRSQTAERNESDTARTPDGPFCMLPASESLSGSIQSKGTQSKTRVSRLFKPEHTVTFCPLA